MLYHLLFEFLGINIFRYPTLRIIAATLTSLMLGLLFGPWFINKIKSLQFGQVIRDDGPQSHLKKGGTPTMGGLLILFCTLIPTLLWANLTNTHLWILMFVTTGYGIIGFKDDLMKVMKKNSKGVSAKFKLVWQTAIACIAMVLLLQKTDYNTLLSVPFLKPEIFNPELGWFYIIFAVFVIVGTSNAVNLTDGLDGLAIGPTIVSSATFIFLTYMAGVVLSDFNIAAYLRIPHFDGASELSIFCASLCGASVAFLWFNSYPASIFMGDVGSLAIGGALGTVAVITKNEIISAILHIIFLVEALSVMAQVASFKLTGKRIFKMSPIHHHFELLGWPEPKIIVRFWILSVMAALVALVTLKIR